jgi:hypothetical protein
VGGNLQAASESAHRLIPPCRHIGASGMINLLREIESLPQKEPGNNDLLRTLDCLKDEFGSVRELILKEIADIEKKIKSD